jgi:hypothetical protein
LRANGSRERAPDDRLREAIQWRANSGGVDDPRTASVRRNEIVTDLKRREPSVDEISVARMSEAISGVAVPAHAGYARNAFP